jgi:hypothetical protein
MKLTARARLETWANVSRTQTDEETYGLRMAGNGVADPVVGGIGAGVNGAGRADVHVVEHAERKGRVAGMTGSTVVIRLRAYRGAQHDTMECFNGLRDEAADAIERAEQELDAARAEVERLRAELAVEAVNRHEAAIDILRLIETIKYIRGIAERGEGYTIPDDVTVEAFVLGYVKRLEREINSAIAAKEQK